MFCPKCGTKNPDDGKFCRKCGTDLSPVSEALSGKSPNYTKTGKTHRKSNYSWESAMGKLFMGAAFLVIAVILGVTGAAGGHAWWYWMLIPAFAMLGTGTAQVLQMTYGQPQVLLTEQRQPQIEIGQNRALPEGQTEFVSPESKQRYDTGDLVPPSVVEKTTRHLELDKEGKTMTLPERD